MSYGHDICLVITSFVITRHFLRSRDMSCRPKHVLWSRNMCCDHKTCLVNMGVVITRHVLWSQNMACNQDNVLWSQEMSCDLTTDVVITRYVLSSQNKSCTLLVITRTVLRSQDMCHDRKTCLCGLSWWLIGTSFCSGGETTLNEVLNCVVTEI